MIEDIVEDARILAATSRLRFEVDLPSEVTLQADQALLHTALFNLITNAVKHNEPGGRVRIHATSGRDQVVLEIGNSGRVIPVEEQSRIFDRFHRVDSVRRGPVDGIGLGLSLAREIIRAHGGDLSLKQSESGWTVFQLRLTALR
jgi:signal transduction histidine kinase